MERNATTGFYVEPYSISDLSKDAKAGLLVLGALGMLSVTALLPVISFITFRLFAVSSIHLNQPIILCYNLLLADLFQAIAFLISFHWVVVDGIFAPSSWCHVQGTLLNLGDLSSGFFVLFIALHTAYTITSGKTIKQNVFASILICIWLFAIVLTIIGPLAYREKFFTRAGNWCWISPAHETERLVCHYLWTFVNEFGTLVIYAVLFAYLHRKMERLRRLHPDLEASKSINRATRYMILYPLVFVVATLPLAVGRMCTASQKNLSDKYFFGAGALLASCGWLDAVLYTFTRRVLLKSGPGAIDSNPYGGNSLDPRRATWNSAGFRGSASPFSPGIDHSMQGHVAGPKFMWDSEGKSPVTRVTDDEVELVDRERRSTGVHSPHSRQSSTQHDRNSSIYAGGERIWPLPPAESPSPDELPLPVPRRTMVKIEEEPGQGRIPRKYWRMEPVHSTFE